MHRTSSMKKYLRLRHSPLFMRIFRYPAALFALFVMMPLYAADPSDHPIDHSAFVGPSGNFKTLEKGVTVRLPRRIFDTSTVEDNGDFIAAEKTRIKLLRKKFEFSIVYKDETKRNKTGFKKLPEFSRSSFRLLARQGNPVEEVQTLGGNFSDLSDQERTERHRKIRTILARDPSIIRLNPVYYNPETGKPMIVTNNIIIKCIQGNGNAIGALLRAYHCSLVRKLDDDIYLCGFDGPQDSSTLDVSNLISRDPSVEWATPEFFSDLEKFFMPNDPWFPRQQHLSNTGQNGGKPGADIGAGQAWNIERGEGTVKIAIIDDGVPQDHPDLSIADGGRNYVNSPFTYDFWPQDPNDAHGTSCAGVAAAVNNNGIGVSGVAGRCRILPVKIANGGSYASNVGFGDAITFGANNADVVSISWGWNSDNYIRTQIRNATRNGRAGKGCPVFIAAGNGGSDFEFFGARFGALGYSDGSYYFAFAYIKDNSLTSGQDLVAIDNVKIVAVDGYTILYSQSFSDGTAPGWTTGGTADWMSTNSMYYSALGDTFCLRSGVMGNNSQSILWMPIHTFHQDETVEFVAKLSTQATKDIFYVGLYDSLGHYLGFWTGANGSWSGVFTRTSGISYPASVDSATAIGASSDWDFRVGYSQYATSGKTVEFLAPSNGGWNGITTVDRTGTDGYSSTDYTFDFGGTSSATPTASGVAALLLSMNPNLTRLQVLSAMRASCDKIGARQYVSGKNYEYGYGRLNAYNALRYFRPVIVSQTQTPSGLEDHPIVIPLSCMTITDPDNPSGPFSITIQAGSNYSFHKDTLFPGGDFNGALPVWVSASDGHLSSDAFSLTVNVTPVNDAPSFAKGADVVVAEDAGQRTVASWATSISKGPANESGQTLSFTVTNDHTGLFSAQPAVDSGGTLTFTPAHDSNGTANVRVLLKDNGGTAYGGVDSATASFIISVTPVNDPPVIISSLAKTALAETPFQISLSDLTVSDPDNLYPKDFTLNVLPGDHYSAVGATVLPSPGFTGPISVQVTDGIVPSATYAMPITVIARPAEIDTIDKRRNWYLAATGANPANSFMAKSLAGLNASAIACTLSLQANGRWADLSYSADPAANWGIGEHYRRVAVMAQAYRAQNQSLYNNAALLVNIQKALLFVNSLPYVTDNAQKILVPRPGNWWWWWIGVPQQLGRTLVLLRTALDAPIYLQSLALYDALIGDAVVKALGFGALSFLTGQNLVDMAMEHCDHAVCWADTGRLTLTSSAIASVCTPTATGEGVKPDYSFHQHGPVLYTGEYGGSFGQSVSEYFLYTRAMPHQVPSAPLASFESYVTKGMLWAVENNYDDPSTVGRGITRRGINAVTALSAFSLLISRPAGTGDLCAAAAKKMLLSWKDTLPLEIAGRAPLVQSAPGSPALPLGQMHYRYSDFSMHRAESYVASVKMLSSRTRATDSLLNGEGKKSWCLSDGFTNVVRRGDEYFKGDIWPTMDWQRLPGITVEKKARDPGVGYGFGTRTFSGGATLGITGVCAMDFAANGSDLPITAKKSWFFFDNELVCMGTEINCPSSNTTETVIDQRPLPTGAESLFVNGSFVTRSLPWDSTFSNCRTIACDSMGYYFPSPVTVNGVRRTQTGAWYDIGAGDATVRSNPVSTLFFNHGTKANGAAYCYAVVPNKTAGDMVAYAAGDPVTVRAQRSTAHAVRSNVNGKTGIVFFGADSVDYVKVDNPCIVMYSASGHAFSMALSNPNNTRQTINAKVGAVLTETNMTCVPSYPTFSTTVAFATDSGKTMLLTGRCDRPPVIAPIGDKVVDEGATLSFTVAATDPDNDIPWFTTTALPPNASLTGNPDGTAVFSWTPAFDQSGGYSVTFYAHDGVFTDSETIHITVNNVYRPPVLDSIRAKSINENQLLTFTVSATDPDGTIPAFSADVLPAGATLTDHHDGTASFSWKPTFSQSGTYVVDFTASDGALSDHELVSITVVDVPLGSITINGIGAKSEVFLYATSGWPGKKMRTGSGSIPGVDPGTYVAAVRDSGKRVEYIPFGVVTAKDTARTINLRAPVPVIFDKKDTLKSGGAALNTGGFASCAFGDFDADGTSDLIACADDGTVTLYHGGAGDYTFVKTVSLGVSSVRCVRVADWNSDNLPDIVGGTADGAIRVFLNAGGFSFASGSLVYQAQNGLSGFDICDSDKDAAPDFLLGYQTGSVMLAKGGPSWTTMTLRLPDNSAIAAGAQAAPLFLDVSGDGREDLVAANGAGEIRWFQAMHDSIYMARGFVNSAGAALSASGRAALSCMYGTLGEFKSLILSDASGKVYKVNELLRGDVFPDGSAVVDINDLSAFGSAWHSVEGFPGYNPLCNLDLTPDGLERQAIDIFDFAAFGDCYGKQK